MPDPSTILLIDDDPAHLMLYSMIVERAGHRTTTILAERRAIVLPQPPVHAVVLDYRLGPGVTSVELAGQLNNRFPGTPVIVLSDMQWMPEDIAPFAAAFVRKGEPEQLLEAIAIALRQAGESS